MLSSEFDEKMWRNLKTKMVKHNLRFGSREKRANEAQLKRAESHLAHLNNNKPHTISKKWETNWINTQNLFNKLSLINNKTKFLQIGAKRLAKGKKPNKFFLSKYKYRVNNDYISSVLAGNSISKDPDCVSRTIYDFYSILYQSENAPELSYDLAELKFSEQIDSEIFFQSY